MSFNIFGGGAQRGVPLSQTAAAIRAAGADIIGIQETKQEGPKDKDYPPVGPSVAPQLAEMLGYYYVDQVGNNTCLWANAILSRYPIVPGSMTKNQLGVLIQVTPEHQVAVFNVHLAAEPYQPYQVSLNLSLSLAHTYIYIYIRTWLAMENDLQSSVCAWWACVCVCMCVFVFLSLLHSMLRHY